MRHYYHRVLARVWSTLEAAVVHVDLRVLTLWEKARERLRK